MFDIADCDAELNVSSYTAAVLATVVLFGVDII